MSDKTDDLLAALDAAHAALLKEGKAHLAYEISDHVAKIEDEKMAVPGQPGRPYLGNKRAAMMATAAAAVSLAMKMPGMSRRAAAERVSKLIGETPEALIRWRDNRTKKGEVAAHVYDFMMGFEKTYEGLASEEQKAAGAHTFAASLFAEMILKDRF